MGDFIRSAIGIGCLLLPFILMPMLWRRMKRVRDAAYEANKPKRHELAWEEATEADNGQSRVRTNHPNDELIALGEHGRRTRWPINNP